MNSTEQMYSDAHEPRVRKTDSTNAIKTGKGMQSYQLVCLDIMRANNSSKI